MDSTFVLLTRVVVSICEHTSTECRSLAFWWVPHLLVPSTHPGHRNTVRTNGGLQGSETKCQLSTLKPWLQNRTRQGFEELIIQSAKSKEFFLQYGGRNDAMYSPSWKPSLMPIQCCRGPCNCLAWDWKIIPCWWFKHTKVVANFESDSAIHPMGCVLILYFLS